MHCIIKIYNDVQFIAAAVESIKEYVDSIIVADGAYKAYYTSFKEFNPQAKEWSTDGSIEVIKALTGLPDMKFLKVPKGGWLNQVVKMNRMIDAVPEDNWFVDLNADEMLVGKVPEGFKEIEESGCVAGRVPLVNLGCDIDRLHYFWHPRLWKRTKGLHFAGTHWQLRDYADRLVETDYPIWWSQQFVMAHFKPLKPWRRIQPHLAYMKGLRDRGWLEPHRDELDQEGKIK